MIYAREYKWYKDLFFHFRIFDRSVQHFMFDNKHMMLEYFFPRYFEKKYTIFRQIGKKKERISIISFLKDRREDVYWIDGFVPTRNQNKGLGIYAAVASLSKFFSEHPDCTVISSSYSFNTRAIRTTKSIGFTTIVQDDHHFEGSLTKQQFEDNEFVNLIKKRCNIE